MALFGLACRSYCDGAVRQGVPPLRMIRKAVYEQLWTEAPTSAASGI